MMERSDFHQYSIVNNQYLIDRAIVTIMIKSINRRIVILLLLVIVAGVMVMWWVVHKTDKNMRSALLEQARISAMSLDIDRVSSLTGSKEDVNSIHYQRLKTQLAQMRQARHECRFLYLMGQHANGKVFFFADSMPAESKDYAPPGMVYEEVPDSYLQTFDSTKENVVGPITDRWGTLVTALVPIISPITGNLVAVLGMDIDASNWKRETIQQTIFPFATILLLMGLLITLALRDQAVRSLQESEKKYKNLLNSLSVGVVVYAPDSSILLSNPKACSILGLTEDQMMGSNAIDPHWKFLRENGTPMPLEEYPVNQIISTEMPLHNMVIGVKRPKANDPVWVLANGFLLFEANKKMKQVIINFIDITERKKIEEERERLIGKLKDALSEVKTLQGILPICSHCKKIRDDQGNWQKVEKYIHDRSEAEFSHGICPECAKEVWGDYLDDENRI